MKTFESKVIYMKKFSLNKYENCNKQKKISSKVDYLIFTPCKQKTNFPPTTF